MILKPTSGTNPQPKTHLKEHTEARGFKKILQNSRGPAILIAGPFLWTLAKSPLTWTRCSDGYFRSPSQIKIIAPLNVNRSRTTTSAHDSANRCALTASGDRANDCADCGSYGRAFRCLGGLTVVTD